MYRLNCSEVWADHCSGPDKVLENKNANESNAVRTKLSWWSLLLLTTDCRPSKEVEMPRHWHSRPRSTQLGKTSNNGIENGRAQRLRRSFLIGRIILGLKMRKKLFHLKPIVAKDSTDEKHDSKMLVWHQGLGNPTSPQTTLLTFFLFVCFRNKDNPLKPLSQEALVFIGLCQVQPACKESCLHSSL